MSIPANKISQSHLREMLTDSDNIFYLSFTSNYPGYNKTVPPISFDFSGFISPVQGLPDQYIISANHPNSDHQIQFSIHNITEVSDYEFTVQI
jgi:hypothetical protein